MAGAAQSIRLVPARAGHREWIRRLSTTAFASFGDYDRTLPPMLRLPWIRTTVAEVGGLAVGFAMVSQGNPLRGVVELTAIAVEPAWQSRGIGRTLLDHVERQTLGLAPEGGAAVVRLSVAEDNRRARRLFEAAGFRVVPGERGCYPAGQPSLGMRKLIRPAGLDYAAGGPELE